MRTVMLPADSALPGMGIAWDASAMVDVFHRSLLPSDSPVRIERCRIARFRYRAATRCIVLYELWLRANDGTSKRQQWLTGVMYAGKRAKRLYDQMHDDECKESVSVDADGLEPTSYIEELDMFVQRFPTDRYLTALPKLAVGLPEELAGAVSDHFGTGLSLPAHQAARWRATPVRYRPFQSATLRYRLANDDRQHDREVETAFYAKVYKQDGDNEYEFLRGFSESGGAKRYGFAAPLAIVYSRELRTLLVDAAAGEPLDIALAEGRDVAATMRQAADALAKLHASGLPTRRVWTKADRATRAANAGELIGWARSDLRPVVEEIVGALRRDTDDPDPAPAHLDLKPEHVFLDEGRAQFIDFDAFGAGDPVLDAAMMKARLEALPQTTTVSAEVACAAAHRFAEEYFALVPESWHRRLRLNYAYAVLQLALYCVRHQEAQWPRKVEELLARAAQAAASLDTH